MCICAQGAVGLVVKPVVGVADAIASASEGIKNTTDLSSAQPSAARRARLPRALGPDGQLMPYSAADAEVQHVLEALGAPRGTGPGPGGPPKRARALLANARLVAHAAAGPPAPKISAPRRTLVCTTTCLCSVDLGGRSIEWIEPLQNISAVEQSRAELVVRLADGGMRFVPSAEPKARAALFATMDRALRRLA